MKKVCFVEYDMTVTGGVEHVTASLANALSSEYKVYIYGIFGKGGKIPYDLNSNIHYQAELSEKCRIRKRISKVFCPFKRFVKDNKIDVVFLMENHPALTVSPVRFFTRAKYVFCDHGALMNEWDKKDVTAFRYWDALISHRVVTLTERTRQDYIERFKISPRKLLRIYNWIPPEVLEMKETYNPESKCLITVGRFSKEKGYDMLVKVASRVMPSHPDWQWHIYGDGDMFQDVLEKIKQLELCGQVILKGNVKEVYKMFGQYAFFVLTSYREGLPLVLLEAKASGLPMISFDVVTGPGEIIRNEKDGYLIPMYNIDEMVSKILELMGNREKRLQFSRHALTGLEKFEKEYIYNQWKALIEDLT